MTGARRWRHLLLAAGGLVILWALLAYVVLPLAWTHHEHQPQLTAMPMLTRTAQHIPGDPINVGLVGSREDVVLAMHQAGWFPADPVTLRTSIEIAGSVVLDRPYRSAPVSPLYFLGRMQDLAFEKPSGTSADRRHHVRFWLTLEKGEEGRPVWVGAVTFDRSVGFSHYTGAITHHVAPDVDAERDALIAGLVTAGLVEALYQVTGVGPTLNGRNGGGDLYYTDGEIHFARLVPGGRKTSATPLVLDAPQAVRLKDQLWAAAKGVLPD
jgi:LssY C-terminus